MKCPKCDSEHLLIRQRTGLEKLVVMHLTRKRKYMCMDCNQSFRAAITRRIRRGAVRLKT
jgi:transposase-like protein